MVDKNVFTQELSKVFTILQEVRLVEKYIKDLIDSNNLTEDKVVEFEEKLNQYKRDLDYINENTEQLQESLNQMNINIEDLMEYVDSIKDFINQNENTTEVGGNLEVDGNITINSVDNLITKDGSTFGEDGNVLYHHCLYIQAYNYNYPIACTIISNNPESYTFDTLKNYLITKGYKGVGLTYPVRGSFMELNKTNRKYVINGICSSNDEKSITLCGQQYYKKTADSGDTTVDIFGCTTVDATLTYSKFSSITDNVTLL